jgi:hypothetical protein
MVADNKRRKGAAEAEAASAELEASAARAARRSALEAEAVEQIMDK